jgi:tungstate transport system permease protein
MSTFQESLARALQLVAGGDPALFAVVGRSLAVSGLACLFACAFGLLLGGWLGVARFPGRGAVVTVLNTFLAVPSVVVGLVVYLLLSRSGPLGFLGWLFSFHAMVLAQVLLVLPVCTALTRQVVEDAERANGEQLQALGAGGALRSVLFAFDERYALVTVLLACFGRAISEVGAVMIVGGNIDHGDCAGDQQGRPAAGAGPRPDPAGRGAGAQCRDRPGDALARHPCRRRGAGGSRRMSAARRPKREISP